MSYNFTITGGMRVKRDGEYPWPCESDPDRTIELFTDDVLTVGENGKVMKHTGLGCTNIIVPAEDLEPWPADCNLRLL